eukprot:486096-Prymnesium_polylepis.1
MNVRRPSPAGPVAGPLSSPRPAAPRAGRAPRSTLARTLGLGLSPRVRPGRRGRGPALGGGGCRNF